MPNAYVSLEDLKAPGALNISGAEHDARLLRLAETASRAVDRYCNRHFYVHSAAKTFDGSGLPRLLVPDLIAVNRSGLKTDGDGDGHFETTWHVADFYLLPRNAAPDDADSPASRPYTAIAATGKRARFVAGRANVRVSGQWGWWRHARPIGSAAKAIGGASDVTLELADNSAAQVGQTLLVGSEQMYVEGRQSNALSVLRGVNGTTATAHDAGAQVRVYDYPPPVREATLTLAAMLWRRNDSVYDDGRSARGGPSGGMEPLAAFLLSPYRKPALGVGV